MAVIRRVTVNPPVSGKAQRIIPPPNVGRSAQTINWTVVNIDAANSVELVDDESKDVGGGLPLAPMDSWDTLANGYEQVYASVAAGKQATVVVLGAVTTR